jgi:hypothetical protein
VALRHLARTLLERRTGGEGEALPLYVNLKEFKLKAKPF